jgi:hypothetical protein
VTPSPQQAQPISDEGLDQLIDAMRPQIREAIRAVFEGSQCNMFELAQLPLPSGQKWSLVMAIMIEPFAAFAAHALMQGVPAMRASFEKQNAPAPSLPAGSGFEFPV